MLIIVECFILFDDYEYRGVLFFMIMKFFLVLLRNLVISMELVGYWIFLEYEY